jgi:hypothetical protein
VKFLSGRQFLYRCLAALHLVPRCAYLLRVTDTQPSPAEIRRGEIIAVKAKSRAKWACFHCPCSSGEIVRLPIDRGTRPTWSLKIDFLGRPTLHPSIWQQEDCCCHFWIRHGAIIWCDNLTFISSDRQIALRKLRRVFQAPRRNLDNSEASRLPQDRQLST